MRFEPLRTVDEILGQFGAIDLTEQLAAFKVIAGITADSGECIRCKRNKVLERESPRNIFRMRIQPTVFVYDEHGRQPDRCFGTRGLAEWPDEIAPDVAVPVG